MYAISGQWGQVLGLKMAISNHGNCLKNGFFNFFLGAPNLIQELDFGALWASGGALGYAKLFPDVCLCFPGN